VHGSEDLLPQHPMPPAVRVCGKLAVLDDVLTKLLAAKHKVVSLHNLINTITILSTPPPLKL